MAIEQDAWQALKALAEWSEQDDDPNTGHYRVSGKELQDVLQITPNRVNDAVKHLVGLGQANVMQLLNTTSS